MTRWVVRSQVVKSVTEHYIKQQEHTNRKDQPGRLADRQAGPSTAPCEEAEAEREMGPRSHWLVKLQTLNSLVIRKTAVKRGGVIYMSYIIIYTTIAQEI